MPEIGEHCFAFSLFDHALDSSAWPFDPQHREDAHRRPAKRKPAPEPRLETILPVRLGCLACVLDCKRKIVC